MFTSKMHRLSPVKGKNRLASTGSVQIVSNKKPIDLISSAGCKSSPTGVSQSALRGFFKSNTDLPADRSGSDHHHHQNPTKNNNKPLTRGTSLINIKNSFRNRRRSSVTNTGNQDKNNAHDQISHVLKLVVISFVICWLPNCLSTTEYVFVILLRHHYRLQGREFVPFWVDNSLWNQKQYDQFRRVIHEMTAVLRGCLTFLNSTVFFFDIFRVIYNFLFPKI